MITVTETALAKLKSLKEEDKALRIAVVGGGCSGLSYKLSWVSALETTLSDEMISIDGLVIVVDPKSWLFIKDLEMEYSDGLDGQGFTFKNPMAKRSCGCGSSFST